MKILVLTSVYPQPEDDKKAGVTPVVHYFAKEWANSGHEVVVIHNANKFNILLYMLPRFIKQKINSTIGMAIPKFTQRRRLFRFKDGVKIIRVPILKLIPRMDFMKFQISIQLIKIKKILSEQNFEPEIIIGHWETPQIQLVSMLKNHFDCRSAIIFHGIDYLKKISFKKNNKIYLDNIDVFGARSKVIADHLKETLKLSYTPFTCYSGIPESYYNTSELKKHFNDGPITEYLYVGRLIKRKNVDTIIQAISQLDFIDKINFEIVGTGDAEKELVNKVRQLSINENVNFRGLQTREDVFNYMKKAQCFTMVSSNEVFGLVYLEAMAQGCIVIAAKDEGFDGIIIDGKNGFLCDSRDVNQLKAIYIKINNLSKIEKESISKNAIKTSKAYKESEVAKYYLRNILEEQLIK